MNWINGFTFLIVVVGVVVGLSLAAPDILNPTTTVAEAKRIDAETRHLDAMNQLEEQLAAAKTEAEITTIRHNMELEEARYQAELARIAADQKYYQESLRIKLGAQQMFLTVLVILGGTVGLAIILVGTRFVLVRIQPPAPVASPKQLTRQVTSTPRSHHSPNGYEQMRIQARQRELLERQIMLQRMKSACNPSKTTKEDYQKLPLAGD